VALSPKRICARDWGGLWSGIGGTMVVELKAVCRLPLIVYR